MSDSENVKSVKVGDVVDWGKVPSGALVLEEQHDGDAGAVLYSLRIGEWYRVVHNAHGWREWAPRRQWSEVLSLPAWCIGEHVTIIATGLTGKESARDLQRLAEVFEIREALAQMNHCDALTATDNWGPDGRGLTFDEAAPLLHAAGWRPGMTAEDAARLLSEADNTRAE